MEQLIPQLLGQLGVTAIPVIWLYKWVKEHVNFLTDELKEHKSEVEKYRLINKDLTDQILEVTQEYSSALVSYQKENIQTMTNVTQTLNEVIDSVNSLKSKINEVWHSKK